MRAFYATHKYIRVFVFGVPEGWHVAVYDLQRQKWIEKSECVADSLKDAKKKAEEKAAAMLGTPLPELKWH